MNRVDPKLLQVFADVVDQGSFTGAADLRETNVSYISRQIKALESELKATLLNRSTRAIALTDVGRQVYDNARQINDIVKNVSAITEEQSESLRGTLRITSAVYIGRKFLFPIVEKLCDQHPEIDIELQFNDNQVDIIKERFDLAFRVWTPRDVDLIAKKLLDVKFLLAAHPSFAKKYGAPKTVEELSSRPAIVYARKGHTNRSASYLDDAGELKSFNINANLCVNDAEQLNLSVANGERYVLATNFMAAEPMRKGELVRLLPKLEFFTEDAIYAVYPNRVQSRLAKLIIEEMKSSLQSCVIPGL